MPCLNGLTFVVTNVKSGVLTRALASVFFLPEKKKVYPRKFSIFCPRSFQTSREKILKTAREERLVPEKKTAKFHPRKKRLPEKKMQNCARENSKSTREKIRSKISSINFFHAISATVAGLCYGDFSSICLMLSSRLCNRYFGLNLCAPAASLSYYDSILRGNPTLNHHDRRSFLSYSLHYK